MIDKAKILPGTRPSGISLMFLNRVLGYVGLVLAISIDIDKDGRPTYTKTRLWIERIRKYEARTAKD